jgi:hypothetical protein
LQDVRTSVIKLKNDHFSLKRRCLIYYPFSSSGKQRKFTWDAKKLASARPPFLTKHTTTDPFQCPRHPSPIWVVGSVTLTLITLPWCKDKHHQHSNNDRNVGVLNPSNTEQTQVIYILIHEIVILRR